MLQASLIPILNHYSTLFDTGKTEPTLTVDDNPTDDNHHLLR